MVSDFIYSLALELFFCIQKTACLLVSGALSKRAGTGADGLDWMDSSRLLSG